MEERETALPSMLGRNLQQFDAVEIPYTTTNATINVNIDVGLVGERVGENLQPRSVKPRPVNPPRVGL